MYASIDAVTDRLAKKLKKDKERRLEGYHGGPNMGENLAQVLDSLPTVEDDVAAATKAEDEEFIDPEAPVVTKIKSYDLSKPISIEEAIFALGYVDHDFYVFREEKTNEINVVYKRNAGGYGLIAPQ
jgi:putative sigma-54 modulation protein